MMSSGLLKKNSRSAQQLNRMTKAEKLNICPFCPKGLNEIHRLPVEKETFDFFVTKNAFPYEGTSIHYLIVFKKHITKINNLEPDKWVQIGELFDWILENTKTSSGGLFLRFGDMHWTGSSIEHLHFQVISGTKSDKNKNKSLKVKLGYK